MKKNKPQANAPALRFPEFRESGEWEEVKFEDICHFVRGPFGGALKKEIFVSDGYAVYEQSHAIHKNFNEFRYYIDEKKYEELKRFSVKPNDLIMSCSGTMGKFAIIPESAKLGVINQALLKLTVNSNHSLTFMLFNLERQENQKKILSQSAGGAIKNVVGVKVLKEIPIVIPTIEEQQKIADCLSSLDELITAESEQLTALKTHKTGLMQQLFPSEGETTPKLRFPEFQNDGEWEEKTLINVTDKEVKWSFIGGPFGSNLKSSDYTHSGIRIIQLQNIGDGDFIDDYKIYTSYDKADELLSNNIYCGDILMSKMGDPVGRACIIPDQIKRSVMCSDGIRLVIDASKNNKYFIYSLLNSRKIRNLIESKSTGSTRKRIGLDVLKKLPILVPKKAEQQKIADCLSSLDALITAQAEKIEQLKKHKKGLMQQLFPSMDGVSA